MDNPYNNLTDLQKEICQNIGLLLFIWMAEEPRVPSPAVKFIDEPSRALVLGAKFLFGSLFGELDDDEKEHSERIAALHREAFATHMARCGISVDGRALDATTGNQRH